MIRILGQEAYLKCEIDFFFFHASILSSFKLTILCYSYWHPRLLGQENINMRNGPEPEVHADPDSDGKFYCSYKTFEMHLRFNKLRE